MTDLAKVPLPVGSLDEALPHLRRPFTPEAVRFKIQTVFKGPDGKPTGCLVVSYIDARLVIERLNTVLGSNWTPTYEPVPGSKLMWCHLSAGGPDAAVRSDVGESAKGMSKDLVSDALKRAAVHFGVGVSLYALKQVTINFPDSAKRLKPSKRDGLALTDEGLAWLRKGYQGWLDATGVEKFGPVLDHGDVLDAAGSEVEAVVDAEPVAPEPLDDDRAQALQAEIAEAYAALKKAAPRAMTPADFEMRLARVSHDHAALEAFQIGRAHV